MPASLLITPVLHTNPRLSSYKFSEEARLFLLTDSYDIVPPTYSLI